MFWEGSEDGTGSQSIIQNVALALGGNDSAGLDSTQNQLLYPDSLYSNLKSGIPESSSASTPATSSSSALITPISSITTPITTAKYTTIPCWGQLAAGVGHTEFVVVALLLVVLLRKKKRERVETQFCRNHGYLSDATVGAEYLSCFIS
jgi:hypothetical protein